MVHVPYRTSAEAPGSGKETLKAFESEHGKRSLLLEALANHPPLLEAHSQYFDLTVKQGSLERSLKELVGVVVSRENDCDYCLGSHRDNLIEMFGISPEAVEALDDREYETFTDRERAAIELAEVAARDPKRVGDSEISRLREAGFGDDGIVELLGAVGQFAVANLYVDALSIRPEDRDA